MPPLAWLVICVVAGAAAYVVGWPGWRSYRSREARDLNTDRYLAWRGRASEISRASTREGMTNDVRRRIYAGAALAVVSVLALVAFFAAS